MKELIQMLITLTREQEEIEKKILAVREQLSDECEGQPYQDDDIKIEFRDTVTYKYPYELETEMKSLKERAKILGDVAIENGTATEKSRKTGIVITLAKKKKGDE